MNTAMDINDLARREFTGMNVNDLARRERSFTGMNVNDLARRERSFTGMNVNDLARREFTGMNVNDLARRERSFTGMNVNDLARRERSLTGMNVNDLARSFTGMNVNDLASWERSLTGMNVNDLASWERSFTNVNMATGTSAMSGSLQSGSSSSSLTTPFLPPKSENTILECRVCDEVFHLQGDKVPRLLICGHTVCHHCLSRLTVHGRVLLCPFDRQPTDIGDSGIWGLKKNFALLELLEKLQFTKQPRCRTSNFTDESLAKEREFDIQCDENESHTAVLYCMTCQTHLCLECSDTTHSTRTLIRHRRVPISEKPRENPKCSYHPVHIVEFACLEEECQTNPLMCYICKDYGRHNRHKHTLLETEAENVRGSITSAMNHVRGFGEEVSDSIRRIGSTIQQMEGGYQVIQNGDSTSTTQQVPGSIESARLKVRTYFQQLRETLNRQEVVALTTVDTHIREKLCMLQQQQEDMTMLLSQISAVCHQCETTLQSDDPKVLLAKAEVSTLLDTVQKQQQQFAELREHLCLEAHIPITFTKDNRVHIGPKIEMRVVILGLDDAGKTSLLFKMKQNEFITTIPTIGFNVETVEYKNVKLTIWDVGGQHKIRPLWKHYYFNTQAVIFVIDSHNKERLKESQGELVKLVQEKELKDASLLIFANKQDLNPSISIEELTEEFGLFKFCCNRSWHIQACDANTGMGLQEGLEWLSRQIVAAGAPDLA